jgi:hypothetical protein
LPRSQGGGSGTRPNAPNAPLSAPIGRRRAAARGRGCARSARVAVAGERRQQGARAAHALAVAEHGLLQQHDAAAGPWSCVLLHTEAAGVAEDQHAMPRLSIASSSIWHCMAWRARVRAEHRHVDVGVRLVAARGDVSSTMSGRRGARGAVRRGAGVGFEVPDAHGTARAPRSLAHHKLDRAVRHVDRPGRQRFAGPRDQLHPHFAQGLESRRRNRQIACRREPSGQRAPNGCHAVRSARDVQVGQVGNFAFANGTTTAATSRWAKGVRFWSTSSRWAVSRWARAEQGREGAGESLGMPHPRIIAHWSKKEKPGPCATLGPMSRPLALFALLTGLAALPAQDAAAVAAQEQQLEVRAVAGLHAVANEYQAQKQHGKALALRRELLTELRGWERRSARQVWVLEGWRPMARGSAEARDREGPQGRCRALKKVDKQWADLQKELLAGHRAVAEGWTRLGDASHAMRQWRRVLRFAPNDKRAMEVLATQRFEGFSGSDEELGLLRRERSIRGAVDWLLRKQFEIKKLEGKQPLFEKAGIAHQGFRTEHFAVWGTLSGRTSAHGRAAQ